MVSSSTMQLSSTTWPMQCDSHFGSIGVLPDRDLASSARSRRRLAEASAHFCARAAKRRWSSGVMTRRASASSASITASASAVSRRSAVNSIVGICRLAGSTSVIATNALSGGGLVSASHGMSTSRHEQHVGVLQARRAHVERMVVREAVVGADPRLRDRQAHQLAQPHQRRHRRRIAARARHDDERVFRLHQPRARCRGCRPDRAPPAAPRRAAPWSGTWRR